MKTVFGFKDNTFKPFGFISDENESKINLLISMPNVRFTMNNKLEQMDLCFQIKNTSH